MAEAILRLQGSTLYRRFIRAGNGAWDLAKPPERSNLIRILAIFLQKFSWDEYLRFCGRFIGWAQTEAKHTRKR